MTATAPLLQADPFAWLPLHMRPAALRYGFGQREGACRRVLTILGRVWYTDGGAAVSSGVRADDDPDHLSLHLTGRICWMDREPAQPRLDGGYMRIGAATISAAYHGLVEALWLPVTWEAGGELEPMVAYVRNNPVAIVMPLCREEKR